MISYKVIIYWSQLASPPSRLHHRVGTPMSRERLHSDLCKRNLPHRV